jgi:hypothetical protein
MTDTQARCMHEACSCAATQGDYCSDYCRESAGKGFEVCDCGHIDCTGSDQSEAIA